MGKIVSQVGLAETSDAMPLKVLHKLLENPDVAFVGPSSHWRHGQFADNPL